MGETLFIRIGKLLFILITVWCCGITNCLFGQVTTQNYVRTRTMLNEAGDKYVDQIQYVDGFGRDSGRCSGTGKTDMSGTAGK